MKTKFLAVVLTLFFFTVAFKTKAETITVNEAQIFYSITFDDGSGTPIVKYPNAYDYTQTFDIPDGFYYTVTFQTLSSMGSFIDYGHMDHTYTYNYQNYSESAYFSYIDTSTFTATAIFSYGVVLGTGRNTTFSYIPDYE